MHVSLRMWPWLWHRCGKGCCVGRAGQNSMWLGVHRSVSLWHFFWDPYIKEIYHPMHAHGTTSFPSTKGLQEMQMQQAAERTSWVRQYLYVFFTVHQRFDQTHCLKWIFQSNPVESEPSLKPRIELQKVPFVPFGGFYWSHQKMLRSVIPN